MSVEEKYEKTHDLVKFDSWNEMVESVEERCQIGDIKIFINFQRHPNRYYKYFKMNSEREWDGFYFNGRTREAQVEVFLDTDLPLDMFPKSKGVDYMHRNGYHAFLCKERTTSIKRKRAKPDTRKDKEEEETV